jgi:hypothetical protein
LFLLFIFTTITGLNSGDASKTIGEMKPFWSYFGYDEPTYATRKDGQKLLTELRRGFTAKRGTAVRGISLVENNAQQIEGKVNGQQIVIFTQFVKKSG